MSDGKMYMSLSDILKSLEIEDLVFDEEEIRTHYEISDKRKGYILNNIKGFAIPNNISVAYVHGKNIKGEYWYVITMKRNEEGMVISESIQETLCKSDGDAKKVVINEVIRLMNC
jgi:hypothetical protein